MTITTLPEHLMPMIEKAAMAAQAQLESRWEDLTMEEHVEALELAQVKVLAFLNACLESGTAREARRWSHGDVWWGETESDDFTAHNSVPALIIQLEDKP